MASTVGRQFERVVLIVLYVCASKASCGANGSHFSSSGKSTTNMVMCKQSSQRQQKDWACHISFFCFSFTLGRIFSTDATRHTQKVSGGSEYSSCLSVFFFIFVFNWHFKKYQKKKNKLSVYTAFTLTLHNDNKNWHIRSIMPKIQSLNK